MLASTPLPASSVHGAPITSPVMPLKTHATMPDVVRAAGRDSPGNAHRSTLSGNHGPARFRPRSAADNRRERAVGLHEFARATVRPSARALPGVATLPKSGGRVRPFPSGGAAGRDSLKRTAPAEFYDARGDGPNSHFELRVPNSDEDGRDHSVTPLDGRMS